ncbi:MAG: hypothetical protein KUG75_03975 [Pseudomonadales bacterium]|nr:hypothetical protein [Pseudomonadales bacterium]
MSVELLDTPRFHGFRVRRQINGKTYQEYFSLKANGKRIRGAKRAAIKKVADARDLELETSQSSLKAKAAKEIHIDSKGRVRGILFRMKTEKSGTNTPVFQIGIMSTLDNKIVNTTVSINLHGLDGAWTKAVDFYTKHKQISKRSKAYKQLMAAKPSKAALTKLVRTKPKKKR